jgi:hypothetical protein
LVIYTPVIGVSDSFRSSEFDGVSFGRACQFQLLQEDGINIQFLLVYRSVFLYSFFLVQSPKFVGFVCITFCRAKQHSLLLLFPVWSVEPIGWS